MNWLAYYKTNDQVLKWTFRVADIGGRAIGNGGVEGNLPSNYEEHRVDYVSEHDTYWEFDRGCIQSVVEQWDVSAPRVTGGHRSR